MELGLRASELRHAAVRLLPACCDACTGMGASPGGLPTTTWRHSLLAPFNKSVAISTYSEYSPPRGHEALLLVQGDEVEG